MANPAIQVAIPQRRYQYGEFLLIVLGDIESQDDIQYQYLVSIVPEGSNKPELFISAEKLPAGNEHKFQMRVLAEKAGQIVGHSDHWDKLEVFCQDALKVFAQVVDLSDERPLQLQ